MIRAAALAFALASAGTAGADPAVPEPQGYHGEPYLSPVPDTLSGATVMDAAAAARAQAEGAVLIDVLPQVRRPEGLPAGTLFRMPRHDTIPGAVWLPGVGYEALSAQDSARFSAALERISGGQADSPLVFFCKPDCWMSWNAARRAVTLGYRRVGWFPGGTDAWAATEGDLTPATPLD
ncbi:rhodanese-like domain-containing protein [Paracoccus sphaerophysae]|uniref:rhodanese-like domain-containing protein n=1 Tax=Paracoccus sphaerophysae TaxID=690417 RepID=UPI00235968E3|nr:rhodanese-like domain-containing protein [Paracoccus sphaerophysae]